LTKAGLPDRFSKIVLGVNSKVMDVTKEQIEETKQEIRIVGICGSLRSGSFTRSALRLALEGAAELGAETQLIDLRDYELDFCHGEEKQRGYPADVHKLRREVKQAQGIILATPEYHGGISGVLKNALDLMGFDQFGGKMMGLIGVSGGQMGAVNALNSLRTIGRSMHAWVIPEQALIPQAWKVFDDTGKLKQEDFEERLKEVGRQVTRFAYLHTSEQALEFLRLWEEAPVNPGGGDYAVD
jgi:NAD(P)H-dependent FMN reductase